MTTNEKLLANVRERIAEVRQRFCANQQERQKRDYTLNELLKEQERIAGKIDREQRTAQLERH